MSGNRQRGWAALAHGRFDLAEKEFRLVLAEEPNDAHCHAGLAFCLCEQEKFDESEREAKLAIGLDPETDFNHYVLARVLCDRNYFKEARLAADEAIRLNSDDANNREILAIIFSRQRKWAECLTAANDGLALDPDHESCLNLRAIALTHLDRKGEASAAISGALERSPESSLTHTNQGWALLHRNDPKAALEHFREALRLKPGNEWAREGLLTALKASNPFYRGVLVFFLFMQRKGTIARWVIIIGILVGQQFMFHISSGDTPLAWTAFILAILATAFVMLTWLANPLMNLIMRFHPHGRHALTQEQRLQSTLIGTCLLFAAGFLVCEVKLADPPLPSIMTLLLCIPIMMVHLSESGWPRRISALVACAFILMAVQVAITYFLIDHHVPILGKEASKTMVAIANQIVSIYFWSILIWSLAAHQIMALIPKR